MTRRRVLPLAVSLALSMATISIVNGSTGAAGQRTAASPHAAPDSTAVRPARAIDRASLAGPQALVLPGQASVVPPRIPLPDRTTSTRATRAIAPELVTSPAPKLPTGVSLRVSSAHELLVNEADARLIMNAGYEGLISTGFDGSNQVAVYPGESMTSMVLDEAHHRLYAATRSGKIAVIDTTTFTAVNLWDTYESANVSPIAYAGGKVWFYDYYRAGTGDKAELQTIDVATGAHQSVTVPGVDQVSAVSTVPGQPDTLSVTLSAHADDPDATQQWFTAAGTTLTPGPRLPAGCGTTYTSDNSHVLCDGTLRTVPGFAADGTYATTFGRVAAATKDAMAYAGSSCSDTKPIVSVVRNGNSAANRTYWEQYRSAGAMAYSRDGRTLYLVTQVSCGTTNPARLRVLKEPNLGATTISLDVRPRTAVGAVATVTGALSFQGETYAGSHPVRVTRTDNAGVHPLADVVPDSSGAFAVDDPATPLGLATYTATFDTDGVRASATVSAGTTRTVPWDLNADGYADTVVGAPGEDLGSTPNTGALTVLYGKATGVSGAGSISIDQDKAGVPGGNESGDAFGYSSASGDFDHDGFADVAVSGIGEDTGSAKNSGAIWIFYGSRTGPALGRTKMITVANTIYGAGTLRSGAGFGAALAAGDFNGDGHDDLAVGAVGLEHVIVLYGTTAGLDASAQGMDYLQPGSYGVPDSYSTFGWSLSAGDINGDGRDDLAVGSPFDYKDKNYSVGSVAVLYGQATGLQSLKGSQRFTPDTSGVPGSSHVFGTKDLPDSFGWQVVLADVNGDGKADLSVGAPGTPVTNTSKRQDAGTVTVLLSTGTKIGTTGAKLFSQDTAGIPGNARTNDYFGDVMAAGHTNNDRYADVVAYSSGDYLVTVIRGGSAGLSGSAVGWTQNSTGIPGATEAEDAWGASLRFAHFKGIGAPQGMMVGAPGENSGSGAVTFIYATDSGLTGTGSVSLSQNSSGVPGGSEKGDGFGAFFTY